MKKMNMNKSKYQEALDVFKDYVEWLKKHKMLSEESSDDLDYKLNNLQKLVDIYPECLELKAKATPKNVISENGYSRCPICKTSSIGNYCYICGQALDWSEE